MTHRSTAAGAGSPIRLMSAEEIAIRAGQQTPFLRMPPARVFAERAARLRQLALAGHPMAGFLGFISLLADAQQRALDGGAGATLATEDYLIAHAGDISPPYAVGEWTRDGHWRDAMRAMLKSIPLAGLPSPTVDAVRQTLAGEDEHLDAQADRILNGITLGLDFATAPLIAAGLQAHWTSLVNATWAAHGDKAFGRTRSATTCPCCGALPVASIERLGQEEAGFRYLQCSLCSTQWHFVRIKCTHCENTKGMYYETLSTEGEPERNSRTRDIVRAECCPQCDHYLKVFSMEKDGDVEPMADDLATIALDLLLSDAGKVQGGVDLMLYYGDPGDH